MLKKFPKEYHIRLLIYYHTSMGGAPKSRITGDIVADLQIGLQKDWLGWKNLSLQKMSVTVNKSSFCRMTICESVNVHSVSCVQRIYLTNLAKIMLNLNMTEVKKIKSTIL